MHDQRLHARPRSHDQPLHASPRPHDQPLHARPRSHDQPLHARPRSQGIGSPRMKSSGVILQPDLPRTDLCPHTPDLPASAVIRLTHKASGAVSHRGAVLQVCCLTGVLSHKSGWKCRGEWTRGRAHGLCMAISPAGQKTLYRLGAAAGPTPAYGPAEPSLAPILLGLAEVLPRVTPSHPM